ncbi:MAG: hypothetical protein OXI61_06270 [Candidatus Poribacteria bacterium]|nr:hypothetical protein [Candidatus Poribacteria bacterium]
MLVKSITTSKHFDWIKWLQPEEFVEFFARYALLTLFQSIGELPAGGDEVRRSTFGKNANVYEAEAPTFR